MHDLSPLCTRAFKCRSQSSCSCRSLFATLNHKHVAARHREACISCLFEVIGGVVYPDARQLLTLGLDGVAKVWRLEDEEFLCALVHTWPP